MSANTAVIFQGRRALLLTPDGLKLRSGGIVDNDGEFNPLTNGHFELTAIPWATYKDAPGVVPVSGTGGTPGVTLVRSTVSPLQGQASGLFTKDAVNRQGEGTSYDMTDIPQSWSGRLVQAELDFSFSGGYNATTEQLALYIYDITNATLITPYNVLLPTGSGKYVTSFINGVNTSSIRFILHVAATGAAAWTCLMDNVRLLRTENPVFTANKALVTDVHGAPTASSTSDAQIGYLSTATSDIQVQLDAKFACTSIVAISSNVALTPRAIHLVNTSASRTLTLPDPASSKIVTVKDSTGQAEANPITINPFAAETIDGAASAVLDNNYGAFTLISNGTNWSQI